MPGLQHISSVSSPMCQFKSVYGIEITMKSSKCKIIHIQPFGDAPLLNLFLASVKSCVQSLIHFQGKRYSSLVHKSGHIALQSCIYDSLRITEWKLLNLYWNSSKMGTREMQITQGLRCDKQLEAISQVNSRKSNKSRKRSAVTQAWDYSQAVKTKSKCFPTFTFMKERLLIIWKEKHCSFWKFKSQTFCSLWKWKC